MRKQNKITQFLIVSLIVVCVFCIGIFSFLAVYITKQNEKTIGHVGDIYMASINKRISQHFSTMVDLKLSQLNAMIDTLPVDSEKDSAELRDWIENNAKIRGFESISYYFSDGSYETIYGEQAQPIDQDLFIESMKNQEKKISIAVDSAGERTAIIGVPFKIEMNDGRLSIAMMAKIPLSYLSETLSLDLDTEQFYSFIIRKDGSFVVRTSDAFKENYFDRVRTLYDNVEGMEKEEYISQLQQAMENNQNYSVIFKIYGEKRWMYCSRLPSSEWYLMTFMSYGPLNQTIETQSYHSFLVFVVSCIAILLLVLIIFLRYLHMNRLQMNELEEARQAATKASRSKSEFLSNMSHDIRTPMNAIVGMTSIAIANINNTERVQDCLKKIILSSKHLLGLINDVLDMSKIESGKMNLNVEMVSLREVMDNIVTIVQPQLKEKQQKFSVSIYDIVSENVLCDGVRLNQILLNLLSNAIKYTPEGGSIDVTMHEQESPKGDDYVRILLQVKDNGIGMSDEFQKHIFDAFTRDDNKRVHKTEGTGLGMAITKHIIDAMGGEISISSKQGVGSEFYVTLDLEKTDEQEQDMILPDFTMLVVDDDRQLCESTTACLKSIGIRAEWTLDGESAIQMVTQRHASHDDYHIILLDWKLPGMDGIKTAKEIRKQLGNDVPILLISAYDCCEIEDEAKAAGVNGFLSKPLFKSTLYYGLKPYANCSTESSVEQEDNNEDFSGKRILLAEDNDLNWEIANEQLKALGLTLEWAENGQICADMFEASPVGYYNAILMDIRMPVKNGYEATDIIRGMDRPDSSIPIIAMTADAFYEDIQKCMSHGMNAHVAKPIDIKEITNALTKCFNNQI